jgi:hypothetical protein
VETALRSSLPLQVTRNGEWEQYALAETTDIEGLQLAIQFPEGVEAPELESAYLTPSQLVGCVDESTRILRYLGIVKVTVEAGKPLFSLRRSGEDAHVSFSILQESAVLMPGYQLRRVKAVSNTGMQEAPVVVGIWPNPGNGRFILSEEEATVLSVSDSAGNLVSWSQAGKEVWLEAGDGIFFISVGTPQGKTVVRAVISQK